MDMGTMRCLIRKLIDKFCTKFFSARSFKRWHSHHFALSTIAAHTLEPIPVSLIRLLAAHKLAITGRGERRGRAHSNSNSYCDYGRERKKVSWSLDGLPPTDCLTNWRADCGGGVNGCDERNEQLSIGGGYTTRLSPGRSAAHLFIKQTESPPLATHFATLSHSKYLVYEWGAFFGII